VRNCDCISRISKGLEEKQKLEKVICQQIEVLSGRTYTNFLTGQRTVPVLHSYCPFCGKPYTKEDP
jgi:hypothetical protein